MNSLRNLIPETLHHAYVLEGDIDALNEMLISLLKERNITIEGNPNIFREKYDVLSLTQSRLLKEFHTEKGFNPGKKISIIQTKGIEREAQHALLKLLEEPAEDTHFFLIIPNTSSVLDTLLSRVHHIKPNQEQDSLEGKAFLNASIAERLAMIEEIIKSHKNDESSTPLRKHATDLLNTIEQALLLIEKHPLSPAEQESHKRIIQMRLYLSTPGASVKMILEHIALVV